MVMDGHKAGCFPFFLHFSVLFTLLFKCLLQTITKKRRCKEVNNGQNKEELEK